MRTLLKQTQINNYEIIFQMMNIQQDQEIGEY